MSNKLDIFEILGKNETENQEQHIAPDFDLLNVEELIGVEASDSKRVAEDKPISEVVKEPVKKELPAAVNERKRTTGISKKTVYKIIKITVTAITVIVLIAITMTTVKVSYESMDPMISPGDRVVINKFAKNHSAGDIILFKTDSGEKHIARIIAEEGDVVNITKNGKLFVNNELQDEKTPLSDASMVFPVIVDEDTFFLLGDNRENAVDSRSVVVGLPSQSDIIGKVVYCFKKL